MTESGEQSDGRFDSGGASEDSGAPVDDVVGDGVTGDDVEVLDEEEFTTPWHFKLMILALAVYLAWRGYQIAAWGIQELF